MVSWGGISCLLSAAIFYLFSRNYNQNAEALKDVISVEKLKDLVGLIEAASKVIPLIVYVSGRVNSDTPIKCVRSGIEAVILEETAQKHFLKKNSEGVWIEDSVLMLSTHKEVPWYLDDGTGHAAVKEASRGLGFELTVASETFEEYNGTKDYDVKMLGLTRIERVLPMGETLNVIGQAVKDDAGTIKIQKPRKGPFYVSSKSIDQHASDLRYWARWNTYVSVGLAGLGLYLIAKHAVQYVMIWKNRRAAQRRRAIDAARQRFPQIVVEPANPSRAQCRVEQVIPQRVEQVSQRRVEKVIPQRVEQANKGQNCATENGSENAKPETDLSCVICLENEYNTVFIPCSHMCCCTSCASPLRKCPLCRKIIVEVMRTYRP